MSPDLSVGVVGILLLLSLKSIQRDEVHVSAESGLPYDLHSHAAVAVGLDGLQRATDRVHGDVRETAGRISRVRSIGQILSGVGLRCPTPWGLDIRARRRHDGNGRTKRKREHYRYPHAYTSSHLKGSSSAVVIRNNETHQSHMTPPPPCGSTPETMRNL